MSKKAQSIRQFGRTRKEELRKTVTGLLELSSRTSTDETTLETTSGAADKMEAKSTKSSRSAREPGIMINRTRERWRGGKVEREG
jgi:hypothetical protein